MKRKSILRNELRNVRDLISHKLTFSLDRNSFIFSVEDIRLIENALNEIERVTQ